MDSTQADLSFSKEDFLERLAASGLFTDSKLGLLASTHPEWDAIQLAQSLLTSETLTGYQLDAICQGQHSVLRMGNYDVLDRLGAGGMGTVFKARHRRMKRIVALKVLSATLSKDPSFVQRFQREVEAIARLVHPNVVMAFDADEAEGGHFLVMEYVAGRDLASLVQRDNPFPVAEAVDCTLQAARGLAYAHSQQIIHRDVKPANLLRDASGVVKVTDLGLARLTTPMGSGSVLDALTQAGGVLGTADYISPEQATDSTTIDHRADVYSLGATLYYLLTGRPMYTGRSMMAVLIQQREAPIPSLTAARPGVPEELNDVFRKMVAKAVGDRFSTMNDVVIALEGVAARLSRPMPSPSPQVPVPVTSPSGSSFSVGRPEERTIVVPPKSGKGVLLIEPSRAQAGIIRKYLESHDLDVVGSFTNGAEAVAAIRANPPGGIVCAMHLPDTTGIELAQQIRNEIPENAPGFVLISSESEKIDVGTLSSLNRVVVLHKPFTPEQLAQSLNRVTGRTLEVKLTDFSLAEFPAAPPVVELPTQPRRDRANLRVLIADDSAVARANARTVLKGLGFAHFTEVLDGAQAIAAATRESFDLIVTDYNMPLMDGHALVSYLRQTAATSAIPIIMVTTETNPKLLDPVRKLGVVAICEKSFPATIAKPIIDGLF